MSKISVEITGNGSAYVSNYDPPNLMDVTLFAYPQPEEHLVDITAMTEYAGSLALSLTQVQSFTYDDTWGHLTIYVDFSGVTPPDPPEPPVANKLLWMLAKSSAKWRLNINGKYY